MANDDESAHRERLNAAGLIIAGAIERLPREVPGITIAEAASVLEMVARVLRESEGWPQSS
jgi:hypothetical protein